MRPLKLLVCALVVLGAVPATASARYGAKKAITGPIGTKDGRSAFGTYRDLGAGIFQFQLHWDRVAFTKPSKPTDPSERRYEWPDELDFVLGQARRSGMKVSVTVLGTPAWANGGRDFRFAPSSPRYLADFLTAASRRFPGVKLWQIGDENNSRFGFQPIVPAQYDAPLTPEQSAAPRRYAALLDAAYGAIKAVDKRDLVVGGNLVSSGDVPPRKYLAAMTLLDGTSRPPRMDVLGYAPYGPRPPVQDTLPPLGDGRADLAEVGTIVRWVDQYLARPDIKAPIPVFFTKWYVPSDHANGQFPFFVSRDEQADYIRRAMELARASSRVYAVGWEVFADEPARADGLENLGGLVDAFDQPKPSYFAFRDG